MTRRSFPCADGRSIAITELVACILEFLVLESDDFTIWLDAMCINQCDVSEKEYQVRLMRDIYASATQVLVWLGGPSGDSSSAFSQIRRLAEHFKDRQNDDFKKRSGRVTVALERLEALVAAGIPDLDRLEIGRAHV